MAPRFGRTPLEGLGTVDVDLAGAGTSEAAVLASLSGKVEVSMPEGARLGVDVERLAAAAGGPAEAGSLQSGVEGATAVDKLVARFAAYGGVFTADEIKADAGDKVVTAEGTVSVPERALDMTVSIDSTPAGNGGPTGDDAGGFRVKGPWTAPTISRP
jgi:uncharacterized protein involved in outer membrane biogenesis